MASEQGGPVLSIVGAVDAYTASVLRERLQLGATLYPGTTLTVDVSALEFIDSSGLGVLVGALRRCQQGGGGIELRGVRPNLQRVLSMTGLNKLFAVIE